MNITKKTIVLILSVLFVLSVSVSAIADMRDNIKTFKTHNAVIVAASGNSESSAIDLGGYQPNGYFSIQLTITGDGTAKVEYLLSNDGVTYIEPASASDITSGFTKTSGPGSDGKGFFSFDPPLATYMKIKVTETGTSNSVTATVVLAIQ